MRFAGTDGVSLETEKWAQVFEREGFKCFYFAGEIDRPPECSYVLPEAHFTHPDIRDIYYSCFGVKARGRYITQKMRRIKQRIKNHLYRFIEKFGIEVLVPENSLTIPLNLPLGIAITEVISELAMPAIAHHHDFFWERQNFLTNSVWEYLNMAFPPHLPSIKHAVINSSGDNQLGLRTGISSTLIPNVMDFENPPQPVDDYAADVREALEIAPDELLILQPTRVVKRKGIEHAIELVSRIRRKAKLVISHASGDEGHGYEQRIRQYSKTMGVNTIFVCNIINEKRGLTKSGRKIYTLNDIYPHADLVTYPSNFEGFGNAFLEAVYFSKPIVVNNYSIYSTDIKPKGFNVIEIDGYVTNEAVELTRKVLDDPDLCRQMVEHNYRVATKWFSYKVLNEKLRVLVAECLPCVM
jgi:glycosyltransferase involved in cell wall biosynthesis